MAEKENETLKIDGQEYYEMYYDNSNKSTYFYNPKTGDTVWELPKGAI
jgi:hypothetical protein